MPNRYLVTGCAGFIGSKVTELLLGQGHVVVGVDSVNDAYDSRLKQWRLARLEPEASFRFDRLDITDRSALEALFAADAQAADREPADQTPYSAVFNLAARAGVRPSVENPWVYYEA
ncbi:MAG: GDP-mannose 4,6-dehydratase, partial [Planctomycetota bacterium]